MNEVYDDFEEFEVEAKTSWLQSRTANFIGTVMNLLMVTGLVYYFVN